MDDLVERLERRAKECASAVGEPPLAVVAKLTKADGVLMGQAAAEITRLRSALETARRDALVQAAFVARAACLVDPDGGSPTEEECAVAEEAARRIRALIQPNTSAS